MQIIKLIGEHGSGKTMLARRLPHLFGSPLRAPHHTISTATLVQEMGMAMGGVLFLDEIEKFSQSVIHALCSAMACTARVNPRVPVLVVAGETRTNRHLEAFAKLEAEIIVINCDALAPAAISHFCGLVDALATR